MDMKTIALTQYDAARAAIAHCATVDERRVNSLVLYDCAIDALAECKFVDEAKDWIDRAAATQAYARMAKDKTLEVDAAEIRIRAERRLGEMLIEQKSAGGLSTGAKGIGKSAVVANDRTPTLSEVGISKDLSARSQKIAKVPQVKFEAEVGEWRDRVSAEGERVTARLEAIGGQQPTPKGDDADDQAEEIAENYEAALRIIDADDKLREAWLLLAEAKKDHDITRLLYKNQRVELATATKDAKHWKRKFEALEKAVKGG